MANVPMEQVIDAIEKQSNYLFAIDADVNISQKVSVSCVDATVETALTQMVKGTDVAYRINGSNVVLSLARKEQLRKPKAVSGKVFDTQGNPVIGAAVIVKGTTVGTSTGADGTYSLSVPPPQTGLCWSLITWDLALQKLLSATGRRLISRCTRSRRPWMLWS